MPRQGIKHTVQCHCVLPQFRKKTDPPLHEFVVFSIIDENDVVEPKTIQCNNCGVVHRVIDICRSEIVSGREDCSFVSIQDLSFMMPTQIKEILTAYDCDLPTWEHCIFILQEQRWGDFIILERKENDTGTEGKLLKFHSFERFTIEPFIDRRDV